MADSNSIRRGNRFKDLNGKRFGKWLVIGEATNRPSGKIYWPCRCECGTVQSIQASALTGNRSRGCKPCNQEQHGMKGTPEYCSWQKMKERCENPNSKSFQRYGRNSISVCARWKSFKNFYADMGPRPSASHTVDRIDGSKGYSPANCRWATPGEQARNRRTTILLTFDGETHCLKDWAARTGISDSGLKKRLDAGWSIERALTEPVKAKSQTGY